MRYGNGKVHPVLLLLLLIPLVTAVPPVQVATGDNSLQVAYPKFETFILNETIEFHVHLFNATGASLNGSVANCSLHLYAQNGKHLLEAPMLIDGPEFERDINKSVINVTGTYPYIVWCNMSAYGGFASNSFSVTSGGGTSNSDAGGLWIIVLLPFLFSIILLYGAASMDPEEHPALKTGLFLLSVVPFFVSLHFASLYVARYFDYPELTSAMGTMIYWVGLFFVVLIFYYLIYSFYKLTHLAAQKREERLRY